MAQKVGPFAFRMKAGPLKGPSDDIADGDGTGKTLLRCLEAKEDAPRRAAGSPIAYISRQGLTDILGDGETVLPDALPSDHELSVLPIQVIEFHMDYFSGTQAEACQKEQDRIVAPPLGRGPIAGLEETLDLLRFKELRQVRQPPVCHRGNGSGQIHRDGAPFVEKTEKTAKAGGDELGTSWAHPVRMA
jgi:hypothetical protein